MKGFALLAAIVALTNFASADSTLWSNSTHSMDPDTNEPTKFFGCGVHQGKASDHFNRTIAALHHNHRHSGIGTRAPRARVITNKLDFQVPMYIHIISSTANAGTITQAMVTAQFKELNKAYNPYGISFTLQQTTWTTNDAWAAAADDTDMDDLKAALRQGTYSDVNLYFHTDLAGGNLGTCTLPSQVPTGSAPSVYVSDGCNINANTMPGGTFTGYNLGKTAVHETGHWLGLLHVFENYSCTGDGDYIADTPMESVSTNGCPTTPPKDSCPTKEGVDPIHNYMDYSTDACYTNFSNDQVKRMGDMWAQYRQGM